MKAKSTSIDHKEGTNVIPKSAGIKFVNSALKGYQKYQIKWEQQIYPKFASLISQPSGTAVLFRAMPRESLFNEEVMNTLTKLLDEGMLPNNRFFFSTNGELSKVSKIFILLLQFAKHAILEIDTHDDKILRGFIKLLAKFASLWETDNVELYHRKWVFTSNILSVLHEYMETWYKAFEKKGTLSVGIKSSHGVQVVDESERNEMRDFALKICVVKFLPLVEAVFTAVVLVGDESIGKPINKEGDFVRKGQNKFFSEALYPIIGDENYQRGMAHVTSILTFLDVPAIESERPDQTQSISDSFRNTDSKAKYEQLKLHHLIEVRKLVSKMYDTNTRNPKLQKLNSFRRLSSIPSLKIQTDSSMSRDLPSSGESPQSEESQPTDKKIKQPTEEKMSAPISKRYLDELDSTLRRVNMKTSKVQEFIDETLRNNMNTKVTSTGEEKVEEGEESNNNFSENELEESKGKETREDVDLKSKKAHADAMAAMLIA
eukprot:g4263.t1